MSRIRMLSSILRVGLLALLALAWGVSFAQSPQRGPAQARSRGAAQAPASVPAAAPESAAPAAPVALPAQAPLDRQIDMIRRILPQARRVGLIYDPGKPVSVAAVKQMLDLLPKAGMSPVEVFAPHTWDVGPAARNLIGRVDLVYTVFDDNVAASYDVLAQTCDQAHIPLFAADPDMVRLGAMASLGLPGRGQASAAGRPARPERSTVAGMWFYLNPGAAARQGVTVPDEILKSAVIIGGQANADGQTSQVNKAAQVNQAKQKSQVNQTNQKSQAGQMNQADQKYSTRQTNPARQTNQTRQTNSNPRKKADGVKP